MKDVLPEFELQDPIAAQLMNVVDMLGHRSGLPRHDFLMKPEKDIAVSDVCVFELISILSTVGPQFQILRDAEPCTEFRNVWQVRSYCVVYLRYEAQKDFYSFTV